MYQVLVNGQVQYEGSLNECQAYAAKYSTGEDADVTVEIVEKPAE